jgi:hypothetical protein
LLLLLLLLLLLMMLLRDDIGRPAASAQPPVPAIAPDTSRQWLVATIHSITRMFANCFSHPLTLAARTTHI